MDDEHACPLKNWCACIIDICVGNPKLYKANNECHGYAHYECPVQVALHISM